MKDENEWELDVNSEEFIERAYLLLKREQRNLEKSSVIYMVEMLRKESDPLFHLLKEIFEEADGLLENIQPLFYQQSRSNRRRVHDSLETINDVLRRLCYHVQELNDYKIDQTIQADYHHMKEEIQSKDEKIWNLEEKIEELEEIAQAEAKKLPVTKGEMEEMLKHYQTFFENSLKKPLEKGLNPTTEVDKLNKELKTLRTEVGKKTDEIIELQKKNRNLIKELKKNLDKTIITSQETRKDLLKDEDNQAERIAFLEDQLTEASTALDQKTRLAQDLKSKNKNLKKKIQELNSRIRISLETTKEENKRLREDPRYKDPKFQPLIDLICDLNTELKDHKAEKIYISQQWKEISSFRKKFKHISEEINVKGRRSKKRAKELDSRFSMVVNRNNDTIFEEDDLQTKLSKKILKLENKKPKDAKRRSSSSKTDGVSSISEAESAGEYKNISISSLSGKDPSISRN